MLPGLGVERKRRPTEIRRKSRSIRRIRRIGRNDRLTLDPVTGVSVT